MLIEKEHKYVTDTQPEGTHGPTWRENNTPKKKKKKEEEEKHLIHREQEKRPKNRNRERVGAKKGEK
ncbi:hypothetical protein JZ751_016723 [Albula glossodonta]|uniref:Uncharacterized protein n=1 Tax=Albula glossodonta TaxID=121402 RepID=A0A8T2NT01_9TELE|nr:hypothetical protein JZ751_016723 [Albula glossodonta]